MGKRARRLKREKKLEPMIQCIDRYGQPLYKLTHSEYRKRYIAALRDYEQSHQTNIVTLNRT